MKKTQTKNSTKFFAAIMAIAVVLLLGLPARLEYFPVQEILPDTLELPARGAWDASNNEVIDLKCINLSENYAQVKVSIFDFERKLLGEEYLELEGSKSKSFNLNKFGIDGSYGTYLVEDMIWGIVEASSSDTEVNCHTSSKLVSLARLATDFDYTLVSSFLEKQTGVSSGFFDTRNPNKRGKAIKNELTVYNLSDSNLNAKVVLYNQDGSRINKLYRVKKLAPGASKKINLGRKLGRKYGIFRVIPYKKDLEYSAVLREYAPEFALEVSTREGSCYRHDIPIFSTEEAKDLIQIANLSSKVTTVYYELVNKDSGEVLYDNRSELLGFSSHEVDLSPYTAVEGELVFSLGCFGFNAERRRKVLVQNLSYNLRSDGEVLGAAVFHQ